MKSSSRLRPFSPPLADEIVAEARANPAAVLAKIAAPQNGAATPRPDKPLRIVQLIAPSKIAGAERSTVSLCRGLSARGHDVPLLVKHSHALIGAARAEGVNAISMRFAGKLNLLAVGRLARWFRRNGVDIVATQLSTASLWGTLAARAIGVPSVATVHALNSKTCYVFADRIIAVSHAVKAHLVEQGIAEHKIRVVYNGINLDDFTPPADVASAKTALGLAPDAMVVGVVAHLSEKKGHKWFLDAAAPLLSRYPRLQILFLGEGPQLEALQTQVETLDIAERVTFGGYYPDVVPAMGAIDILVLPALSKEGFGRVLVEAGALGKPVIGTDVGGIGEVITSGENGFVIEAANATQLESALQTLIEDDELRARMGAAGRARALREFSEERMIEQTERVYRELIAGHARAPQGAPLKWLRR